MSSGFNSIATDSGLVAELALGVYQACKTSSEDFRKMANDVSNLYMVLRDIRDDLMRDATGLSHTQADTLKERLNIAHTALQRLEHDLQSYNKMSFHTQKRFTALHYGLENAGDAHMEIIGTTTSLRSIETKLTLYSHSSLEKTVLKYLKEVREGLHEDSVLNLVSGDEIDKKQNWAQFKGELQELDITPAVLREHKDFIRAVLCRAKAGGMLDPANDMEIPDEDPEVTRMTTHVNKTFEERVANRALDIEERRKKEHVETRKYSPLVALGLRALRIVSDERLIEAADEGNLDQVRNLIRRGANLNASDKWRWTALHMAAYGGFDDIAKELIYAGAEIDARTVDGETPLKLAERNRHVEVVRTIMDEVDRLRDELGPKETADADDNEEDEK
ncbi:hypothetical protein BKA66DRAFT_453444 [Pyrenochaeta sp. MPI-SDFR-AT-0127]|nr:hypothetical protein BKA66DRAFT_453444 [Pyrenochaeta sp. MPI-SDFR-AT-0127]